MRSPDACDPALPAMLLAELARFVGNRLGLAFPEDRRALLARGVRAAAAECGFADAAGYAAWLLGAAITPQQLAVLASHLTIGETYFFREPAGLDRLRHEILPALLATRRALPPAERRLRLWSAGCATGEEAYTVAMLLELAIPDLEQWDVTVLATDVNPRFLDRARRGLYRDWSFRGIDDATKRRFFRPHAEGALEIAPRLRRRVSFAALNLVEDRYPAALDGGGMMDLILCRNLLIYFDASQARKVAGRLADALAPGGSLLIGGAEAALPCFTENDALEALHPLLYRKRAPASDRLRHAAPVSNRKPARPRAAPLRATVPAPLQTLADLHGAAVVAFRLGRHDDAMRLARKALDRAPAEVPPKALVARILANRGALTEAIEWSSRAVDGNKTDPEAHYLHASILIEMGRPAEAAQALTRTLYLAPDHVLAHYALGMLALGEGKAATARRHFDNALAFLAERAPEEIVAEPEGLAACDLADIIRSLQDSSLAKAAS